METKLIIGKPGHVKDSVARDGSCLLCGRAKDVPCWQEHDAAGRLQCFAPPLPNYARPGHVRVALERGFHWDRELHFRAKQHTSRIEREALGAVSWIAAHGTVLEFWRHTSGRMVTIYPDGCDVAIPEVALIAALDLAGVTGRDRESALR